MSVFIDQVPSKSNTWSSDELLCILDPCKPCELTLVEKQKAKNIDSNRATNDVLVEDLETVMKGGSNLHRPKPPAKPPAKPCDAIAVTSGDSEALPTNDSPQRELVVVELHEKVVKQHWKPTHCIYLAEKMGELGSQAAL